MKKHCNATATGCEARGRGPNPSGLIVPLVTPFTAAGELDLPSWDRLVDGLVAAGVHGLVVNATTGESPTLEWPAVEGLTTRLLARVGGVIPILVGTGSANTAESVERTRRAQALGAAAALVVVPYYSRPAPAGVLAHYRAIAGTGLPIVAYNIPYRTGLHLDRDTLGAVLDIPGVVGIKESSGGIANTAALAGRPNKSLLCGDDALFLASLAHGAEGGILAAANLFPRELLATYEAARADRFIEARRIFNRLLPFIELLYAEPNPSPLKWALQRRGLIDSAAVRLPLVPISNGLAARLEALEGSTRGVGIDT